MINTILLILSAAVNIGLVVAYRRLEKKKQEVVVERVLVSGHKEEMPGVYVHKFVTKKATDVAKKGE